MKMDYETLLKRGREQVQENSHNTQRFEIPKVKGHIQGNKTIIINWHQIVSDFNRDVQELTKYVLKELATPGELSSTALILGSKIPASRINNKLAQYVKEQVMCSQCARPDTKLITEKNLKFLKCLACGAKAAIKK